VTIPLEVPTVAIVVRLLYHEPPDVTSLNVLVSPTQTKVVPVTAAGKGLTAKLVVLIHPVPIVYVIIVVPVVAPDTTPVLDPTVAIVVLPLLQVPNPVVSVKVTELPTQTCGVP
jgi:hypothetical protein